MDETDQPTPPKEKKKKPSKGGKPRGIHSMGGRKPGSVQVSSLADKRALAEYARERAIEMIDNLVMIALNEDASDAARVAAKSEVLSRGFGLPVQGIEVTGKDGGSIEQIHIWEQTVLVLNSLSGKRAPTEDDNPNRIIDITPNRRVA